MSVRALRRGAIAASRAGAATPTTYTIYGDASDGTLFANPDGSGTSVDTTGDLYIGSQSGTGYEGFIAFDTSIVVGTITAVTLSLYGVADSSTIDFTLEARLYDWGATLTSADWRLRAALTAAPLMASRSTVGGWSTSGYNVLTSDAAFLSNINKSGFTRLVLCSDYFRLGSDAGVAYVAAKSGDAAGTTQDPKLVIDALV